MLAFIESIIKLLVNLFFADQLAKDNEKLRAEVQQLKQEKEELAQKGQQLEEENQGLIQSNFNIVKEYIALNQEKKELARELERYQSPRLRDSAVLGSPQVERLSRADINQQFKPEDWSIIDQLLQEFNPSEELTI